MQVNTFRRICRKGVRINNLSAKNQIGDIRRALFQIRRNGKSCVFQIVRSVNDIGGFRAIRIFQRVAVCIHPDNFYFVSRQIGNADIRFCGVSRSRNLIRGIVIRYIDPRFGSIIDQRNTGIVILVASRPTRTHIHRKIMRVSENWNRRHVDYVFNRAAFIDRANDKLIDVIPIDIIIKMRIIV